MQDHGITADGEGVRLAQADSMREGSAPEDDRYDGGGNDNGDLENNRIADPLYYWNLSMYHFNDKFYFWLLKPVAQGYKAIAPEPVRIAVSNFFKNLASPARFVGNLLQMKLKNAGDELVRFVTNSTQGLGGFMDVAKSHYGIATHEEDIGQALGSYGIGHGFYLVWPFLGPSSLRDTVGLVGDMLLQPVTYINPMETSIGIRAYDRVNETTFHIGDYEAMKKAAIDPYVSLRNGYVQHRKKQVKE
jgi:phospholipid-binding lipoprotein MlaA